MQPTLASHAAAAATRRFAASSVAHVASGYARSLRPCATRVSPSQRTICSVGPLMASDRSPKCKQCRREGLKLFLKGERCLTEKCAIERRSYPPGEHGRGRIKQSEYLLQLREKQKARRYYGILERQFRTYYEKASRKSGITGEELLRMLETRLDNVVYRLGYAASRSQARQLIRHGHFQVNGRRVNIPSFQVRVGDVVTLKADAPVEQIVRDATDLTASVPAWLQADHDNLSGKVLKAPERDEIDAPVQEQLIVELYSK